MYIDSDELKYPEFRMNLLYCHDNTYFHSETGEVYSQGQFPYSYFAPFLESFETVTVIGRGNPLNHNLDVNKLNLSSGENIDFALMPNINSIKGRIKFYASVNRQVRKLVEEADAVVIRAVSDLGWLAYRHAKKLAKPIAMEMAACAWDSTWNHGSILGRLYAPIRYYRDKEIAANADFVIYVSQDFLQKRYPSKGHTATASNVRIDRPHETVLEKRLQKIAAQTGEDTIITIGLIGTLSHKLKGIDTALHALKEIESRTPGRFVFKILGPGRPDKYRGLAVSLGLEHCVVFDGVIRSGDKVLQWLDGIDIYIQPSFQEGVPRATIEAMSRGCPVIGSTAGGIPELLPPQWLHKPGDAGRLKEALERMLYSVEERSKAAQENFETSKKYASDRLVPVRKDFWGKFSTYAAGGKAGHAYDQQQDLMPKALGAP